MALSVYQNLRGLRTNLHNFITSVTSSNYNVIFFTESWLNDCILDSELADTSVYTVFRRDGSSTGSSKKNGEGYSFQRGAVSIRFCFANFRVALRICGFNYRLTTIKSSCVGFTFLKVKLILSNYLLINNVKHKLKKHIVSMLGDFNYPSICGSWDDSRSFLYNHKVEYRFIYLIDSLTSSELMKFNLV